MTKMRTRNLFMGTTMSSALQTAGEISTALVAAGATSINTDYENGRIVGLDWRMDIGRGQDGIFKMPVRVEPIFRMLNEARTDPVKWAGARLRTSRARRLAPAPAVGPSAVRIYRNRYGQPRGSLCPLPHRGQ